MFKLIVLSKNESKMAAAKNIEFLVMGVIFMDVESAIMLSKCKSKMANIKIIKFGMGVVCIVFEGV